MDYTKGHINSDMNPRMGAESKMWNMLDLKDLVFGARDIDDDLMIEQYISYI